MKTFVTGGAGFIGSHLVDALIERGSEVIVYDNLSLGREDYIAHHYGSGRLEFIKGDLLDEETLREHLRDVDMVFHMAANSDILAGTKKTDTDLKQETIATYNVLEAMRICGIKEMVFASTSAVYGDAGDIELAEDFGPLMPISFYGAAKLACEALISAFAHNFGMKGWIFRFANIMGENCTHGVLYDFVKKLERDPNNLEILGDGKQSKPYLYVKDCVDGMLYGYDRSSDSVNLFNLGCKGATSVDTITDMLLQEMGLHDVERHYTGRDRGWDGDVPHVLFSVEKMEKLGWHARFGSDEAVRHAVKQVVATLKK